MIARFLATWDRLRMPLRINILLAFLSILAPLSIAVIGYNYFATRALAIQAISQQVDLISDRIQERQDRYLRPIANLAQIYSRRFSATGVGALEDRGFAPGVLEAMVLFPQLYSVYVGYEDGDFIQVVRFAQEELSRAAPSEIPPVARYAVRRVVLSHTPPSETWQYLDETFHPVVTRRRAASFDPRGRPWYLAARQAPGVVETGPYEFAASKQPGITFSQRLAGPLHGAVGVDMTISELSTFLSTLRIGQGGHVLIFGQNGQLVAGTRGLQQRGPVSGSPGSSFSTDEAGKLFMQTMSAADREDETLTIKGVDYQVEARALRISDDVRYRVVVLAPLEELLSPLSRITFFTVVISVVIGLLSIPVVLILSTRVAKPILRLAEDAREIQRMQLKPLPEIHTPVSEVHDLADSFSAMKRTLNHVSKYMPRALVRELLEATADPVPGGIKRTISILFTDVQDFTRMSEGMPPTDLLRKATTYYAEVGSAILEAGGSIGRFMGDGIVAYWNAPVEDPDHATHAAMAVLRARSNSEALNRRWATYGWPIMYTRFGLHIGEAIVGNIGLPDRMDYSAFGDCLNIGSRLEGLNKFYGTQILVSGAMAEKLSGKFTLRWVDRVAPKGVTQPMEILELVGIAAHHGAAAVPPEENGIVQTSPTLVRMTDFWNGQVIAPFHQQEWAAALAAVEEYQRTLPEDALAKIYAGRCRQYQESPPGPDWDGVVRYTDK